jgi:hypothetical protein
MPMLVLVMAFNISVALALGFTVGRIYQIRMCREKALRALVSQSDNQ